MVRFPQGIVHYRNAIFQGGYNYVDKIRHGFGVHYHTSNHEIVFSSFVNDQLNSHTVVYINHGVYMYGTWSNGYPHGYFVMRLYDDVIFGEYYMGTLSSKFLVTAQKSNIAAIVEKNSQSQFQVTKRTQLYSIKNITEYIAQECGMIDFPPAYQTIVKYISQYMLTKTCKIKLLNNQYYWFGFERGLGIVFDDNYRICKAGWIFKGSMKGLGIMYPEKNVVEEGDWSKPNHVFAYQANHRPSNKIEKVYLNQHLKAINHINLYMVKYSSIYIDEMEAWLNGDKGRMILAGLISSRKRNQVSLQNIDQMAHNKNHNSKQQPSMNNLQRLKQQIYDEVMKKQIMRQLAELQVDQSRKRDQRRKVLDRSPIGKVIKKNSPPTKKSSFKNVGYNADSVIHETSKQASISQQNVQHRQYSPFGQRIRHKIFNKDQKIMKESKLSNNKSQSRSISNKSRHRSIFDNVSIKKDQNDKQLLKVQQKRPSILKNYQSPYQNINLSNSKINNNFDSSLQAYPLTIDNKHRNTKYSNQQKHLKIIQKLNDSFVPQNDNKQLNFTQKKIIKESLISEHAFKNPFKTQIKPNHTNEVYLNKNFQKNLSNKKQQLNTNLKKKMNYEDSNQSPYKKKQIKYQQQFHKKRQSSSESVRNNFPTYTNKLVKTPTKPQNNVQRVIGYSPIGRSSYKYYFDQE